MTDATTPEAEERQTTVRHPRQCRKPRVFKRRSGRKDESFSPGISEVKSVGQEKRKSMIFRPTWDDPHLDHSPLNESLFTNRHDENSTLFLLLYFRFLCFFFFVYIFDIFLSLFKFFSFSHPLGVWSDIVHRSMADHRNVLSVRSSV